MPLGMRVQADPGANGFPFTLHHFPYGKMNCRRPSGGTRTHKSASVALDIALG